TDPLCQPHLCRTADNDDDIDEVARRSALGGIKDDTDEVAENFGPTTAARPDDRHCQQGEWA
ncbi:hypothetical protein N3930_45770, partial [Bacillus thuringiensis]|nr:hypothetical protein [Bacillus thuringiensis]